VSRRVGVVASGRTAPVYVEQFTATSSRHLVGVAAGGSDGSPRTVAGAGSTKAFPSIADLVLEAHPDVLIFAPDTTAEDDLRVAADNRCAVLLASPLALPTAAREHVVAAFASKGLPFLSSGVLRFHPLAHRFVERAQANGIGATQLIHCRVACERSETHSHELQLRAVMADELDLVAEIIDLDDADVIAALGASARGSEAPLAMWAALRTRSSALIVVEASLRTSGPRSPFARDGMEPLSDLELRIMGEEALLSSGPEATITIADAGATHRVDASRWYESAVRMQLLHLFEQLDCSPTSDAGRDSTGVVASLIDHLEEQDDE
jgi:hypothetical protein